MFSVFGRSRAAQRRYRAPPWSARPPRTPSGSACGSTTGPGALGRLATAIGDAGGNITAHRRLRGPRRPPRRGRGRQLPRRGPRRADPRRRSSGLDGVELVDCARPHVPHARGRQDRGPGRGCPSQDRDDLSMAYTPGVARVCNAIADRPRPGPRAHDQAEHRRHRHRRHRRARPRRHRPGGGAAGHGGQGAPVQGVRRRRRVPDLPRRARAPTRSSRRSSGSRRSSAASTSRTSPRRSASRSRSGCKARLDIPVFHDDQHGTAVVVLAALENALQDRRTRRWPTSRSSSPASAPPAWRSAKILLEAGVDERHRRRPQGRDLRRAATTSTSPSSGSPRTPTPSGARARSTRSCRAPTCSSASAGPACSPRDDLRKMAPRPDRVRAGQPRPRDPPRGGRRPRRGHRHRPQRLPEPDQQRARASPASSAARSTPAPPPSPRA